MVTKPIYWYSAPATIDSNTLSSNEIQQKLDDVCIIFETKLNKLTIDNLQDKCKEIGLVGISKLNKPELVAKLSVEFIKLLNVLQDKKANELKPICKKFNIRGTTGCKKDEIILNILQHCSSNLILKLDENNLNNIIQNKKTITSLNVDSVDPHSQAIPKLSLIKEIEQEK